MKKNYTDIINWIKGLFRREGYFNPEFDWKIILVSFIVLFLVSILFNGFLFLRLKDGKIFQKDNLTQDQGELVDEEKLDKTLEYFAGKEARFNVIRREGAGSVDPSR